MWVIDSEGIQCPIVLHSFAPSKNCFEELLWRHLALENLVQMGNKNIFDDHSKQYG